jgi:hypothetical protein
MRTIGFAIGFGKAKFRARGLIRVAKASAKRLINFKRDALRSDPCNPTPEDESLSAYAQ